MPWRALLQALKKGSGQTGQEPLGDFSASQGNESGRWQSVRCEDKVSYRCTGKSIGKSNVNIRLTHFPLQQTRHFPEKAGIK
jgi:hypothetical protein